MELAKSNIVEVLKQLSESNLIFLSEEDFKHQFAIAFKNKFKDSEFIFDYQININEKNNKNNGKLSYVDAIIRYDTKLYPIEFKYKTNKINITEILKDNSFNISNDSYVIKKHAANDWGHYAAIKDIWRIEHVIKKCGNRNLTKGFFIFITNDHLYYRSNEEIQNSHNSYKMFSVGEGRVIENNTCLDWDSNKPNYSKQPNAKFKFEFKYDKLGWEMFYSKQKNSPFNLFKYLIVEIKDNSPS